MRYQMTVTDNPRTAEHQLALVTKAGADVFFSWMALHTEQVKELLKTDEGETLRNSLAVLHGVLHETDIYMSRQTLITDKYWPDKKEDQ